jgi:hypothetical protein
LFSNGDGKGDGDGEGDGDGKEYAWREGGMEIAEGIEIERKRNLQKNER